LNWSVFARQHDRDFMSAALAAFEQGGGPFLAALSIAGEVHATVLGFRSGDVCYLHSAGVRRQDVEGISPGTLMYALLIQQMIAAGVKVLDLSPGVEEHKLRYGGKVEPLLKVTMWHQRSRHLNRWLVHNVRRLHRALCAWRRHAKLPSVPREI
jgi:CelD/BcsL family acetyltransferase involved in cellulose biosynthesis